MIRKRSWIYFAIWLVLSGPMYFVTSRHQHSCYQIMQVTSRRALLDVSMQEATVFDPCEINSSLMTWEQAVAGLWFVSLIAWVGSFLIDFYYGLIVVRRAVRSKSQPTAKE